MNNLLPSFFSPRQASRQPGPTLQAPQAPAGPSDAWEGGPSTDLAGRLPARILPSIPDATRQSRRDRLAALRDEHTSGGFSWRHVGWATTSSCFSNGVKALMGVAVGRRAMQQDPKGMGSIIGAQMMTQSLVQAASAVFEDVQKAWGTAEPDGIAANQRLHRAVKRESEAELKLLPSAIQTKVRDLDSEIANAIRRKESDVARVLLERRQGLFMSWPNGVRDVSHQHVMGDPEQRALIDANVRELIAQYPAEVRPNLQAFVAKIRENVYHGEPTRAQAYLLGPSGTGKTYFTTRLAKALNVPMFVCKLTDDSSFARMVGPTAASGNEHRGPDVQDDSLVGELPLAVIDSGCSNPIIVIEEAGNFLYEDDGGNSTRAFMAGLLKRTLDPACTTLDLPALKNAQIDFSRATVILTGNYPISDEALAKRLFMIHFSEADKNARPSIAETALRKALASSESLPGRVSAQTRAIMDEWMPRILEADDAAGDPGVRTLEHSIGYCTSYVRSELLQGNVPDPVAIEALLPKAEAAAPSECSDVAGEPHTRGIVDSLVATVNAVTQRWARL